MLFSKLYEIMVNKVTFVGDSGDRPPWIRPCVRLSVTNVRE